MERWQQIQSLFQEAPERDPAERNAWLQEACQGDSELQRRVSFLLANHLSAPIPSGVEQPPPKPVFKLKVRQSNR